MHGTTEVIVLAVICLVCWDIFAAAVWGRTATISYDVMTSSKLYPGIAFAAGVLCGHLFFSQRP